MVEQGRGRWNKFLGVWIKKGEWWRQLEHVALYLCQYRTVLIPCHNLIVTLSKPFIKSACVPVCCNKAYWGRKERTWEMFGNMRAVLPSPPLLFRNINLEHLTAAVLVRGCSLLSIFLPEVYYLSSGVAHLLGRAAYLASIMDRLSLHCNHQIELGVDGEWSKQQYFTSRSLWAPVTSEEENKTSGYATLHLLLRSS